MHTKNTRMCPAKIIPTSEEPHQIVDAYENVTFKIQRGGNREDISITRIEPFLSKNNKSSHKNLELLSGIRKSWCRLKQPIIRVTYRCALCECRLIADVHFMS